MQKRGIIKEEYTEPHEEESLPVLVEDQQNPSNQKEQSDQTPLK